MGRVAGADFSSSSIVADGVERIGIFMWLVSKELRDFGLDKVSSEGFLTRFVGGRVRGAFVVLSR
jgi:hypothetical protein